MQKNNLEDCEYDDCVCDTHCEEKIPAYYVGRNGLMAKDVVWEYDLTYNVGTAVTYLLRSKRKHKTPLEDLKKAIAHIEFEINNLENEIKIN